MRGPVKTGGGGKTKRDGRSKMNNLKMLALAAALALTLLPVRGEAKAPFSWDAWDGVLKRHVRAATVGGVKLNGVDYRALRTDRAAFDRLVARLDAFPGAPKLRGAEKLAFWINVYNVAAVKLILDNPEVESIKDLGGIFSRVWKKDAIRVGGRTRSLHVIEHEILRRLSEPRIHFAIVCASVSCPDLRAEAYRAARLEAQLDEQTRSFLANRKKGMRVDAARGKLRVSKIFDWFEEDFGGEQGVRDFVARYGPPPGPASSGTKSLRLSYLPYDWKLNSARGR